MINIDKILAEAIERDASDINLISGIKPMYRIARELVPTDCCDELNPDDMIDLYDYFIRGNIDKDKIFKETRKLDS